jgi:hypothetical protein
MAKILYQIILILFGGILMTSCNKLKKEIIKEDSVVNEANRIEETDSTDDDFNNQDYGDPGLSATIVHFEDLDTEVKDFLLRLDGSKLGELIESKTEILLLSRGQGVNPIVKFGNSAKHLLAIKELAAFLSSSVYKKLEVYRALQDNKCTVIEGYPDGIYLGYGDFQRFAEVNANSDNEIVNKKLAVFKKSKKEKYGNEFLLKFTSDMGEILFVDIITYKEDGKLFIGAIDQRDCGA